MCLINDSAYARLLKLIPHLFDLEIGDHQKSKVSGLMDLNIEILSKTKDYSIIALSHYYEQNGDLIPDPDMEIKVYRIKKIEALTYQDTYMYQDVYDNSGKVNIKIQNKLNIFLASWLRNCLDQHHMFVK